MRVDWATEPNPKENTMTLGINDIRNFSAGDRLVFDTRDGTLKAAGKWQNFKSIVGIGDARAQNALTLAAIHHAIAAEPRFFSQTIQDEAYRLLSEVRTDRAIDAAQIKGIVEHLEALSILFLKLYRNHLKEDNLYRQHLP